MAAKFYALSYEETGSIVSYCQLQRRDLSKTGAVAALLDELVGDELVLSLSLSGGVPPIKIKKTQLALDEVDVADSVLPAFRRRPQDFVLDLTDASAKPGDGKLKSILETPIIPTTYVVQTGGKLVVTFQGAAPQATRFYAIVDGQARSPYDVPTPAQPTIEITIPTSTANSFHTVLLAGRGVQPFFGFLKAQ
jgi:hypothetical protein